MVELSLRLPRGGRVRPWAMGEERAFWDDWDCWDKQDATRRLKKENYALLKKRGEM